MHVWSFCPPEIDDRQACIASAILFDAVSSSEFFKLRHWNPPSFLPGPQAPEFSGSNTTEYLSILLCLPWKMVLNRSTHDQKDIHSWIVSREISSSTQNSTWYVLKRHKCTQTHTRRAKSISFRATPNVQNLWEMFPSLRGWSWDNPPFCWRLKFSGKSDSRLRQTKRRKFGPLCFVQKSCVVKEHFRKRTLLQRT